MSHKSFQGPQSSLQCCYRQWAIKNFREVVFLLNHLQKQGLRPFLAKKSGFNTENHTKKSRNSWLKTIQNEGTVKVFEQADTHYM
jgi:hypothetical protein